MCLLGNRTNRQIGRTVAQAAVLTDIDSFKLPDERSGTENTSRLSGLSGLSSETYNFYSEEFDPGSG